MKDGSAAFWILLFALCAIGAVNFHNVIIGLILAPVLVGLIVLVLGAYTLLKRLF